MGEGVTGRTHFWVIFTQLSKVPINNTSKLVAVVKGGCPAPSYPPQLTHGRRAFRGQRRQVAEYALLGNLLDA